MSTIDTKLQNLNIYEGTLQQIVDAGIGVNDIAFATDVYFEDKFRYSIMPVASSDYLGQIVQYIGGTNDNYISGGFYKCVYRDIHIDEDTYSVLEGQEVRISDLTKFREYISSPTGIAYVTLKQYGSRTDAYGILTKYDSNDQFLNSEACFWNWMYSHYGIEITGPQYFDSTVYVKFVAENYTWQLIRNDSVVNSVDFTDITGDPHDNVALDAELNRIEAASAIQVTSLPTITEDTKDNIYQYVGIHDPDNGLFQGSFYKAISLNYEVDTEESVEIDNMTMNVFNETLFREKLQNIKSSYPDATYLDILFSGDHSNDSGYTTGW